MHGNSIKVTMRSWGGTYKLIIKRKTKKRPGNTIFNQRNRKQNSEKTEKKGQT
jgi:hypothetical protein